MRKFPKGYRGIKHQTIGSDLLGIVKTLKMPDIILGKELTQRMRAVKADAWYPISELEALMEKIRLMQGGLGMRQMGRKLFEASHADFVRANVHSVRQFLSGVDGVYHRANRGVDIGGWKLTKFNPQRAEMEKNTIHDCIMEEGILLQGIETVGGRATISQPSCFQMGAELCRYEIIPVTPRAWDDPT